MCRSKRELLLKLQSLINRYRGAENFVHMMDEWPKTIRALVFSSTPLMIRLGMLMPLDDYDIPENNNDNLEVRITECKKGNHHLKLICCFPTGMSDSIIRWCEVCGVIVGDIEEDNRLQPGAAFKMISPEISK